MSIETAKISKKTLINLMLALLVFFLIINAIVITQQRELLISEHENSINTNVIFFTKLTKTALLKNDYANIEQSINEWGEDSSHIINITLTSKNNFIIAEFSNNRHSDHPAYFSHKINYSSNNHALLKITISEDDIYDELVNIAVKLTTGSILLVILFGAILWRILLSTAIKPLQHEITEHELTSKRLHEAKLAAEQANKSKSEFLANMSHEIRTPMNGVLGMLSLLLDTELTDKQKDFARTAYNSGDTLLIVLNDILDFSKIEAGKLTIETISFNPSELIEETVSLMSGPAQRKGLELAVEIAPSMPTLLQGDSSRIRQVLTNLISNAVKFTERGEVYISADYNVDKDHQHQLTIRVKDTGIGITEEQKETIFSAFEQADNSTTRVYGGTGLGLSISKKLCQLMNGEMILEPPPHRHHGSIFSFSLPLAESKNLEPDISPEHSMSLIGKRVLIVDDNKTNREILQHLFENWKIDYHSAESAKVALSIIAKAHQDNKPIEIIVTDMMMPGIDGNELTELVKSDPRNKQTSVILLSSIQPESNTESTTIDNSLFHAVLTKPVKQSLLFDSLISITNKAPVETKTHIELGKTQEPFSQYNAILAEDNITNQRVAQAMLDKLGFNLITVANGIELLEELKNSVPDLIFMDCQMPSMDGYAATEAIRQMESPYKDIIIIAMTANAMKEDRGKCLLAGMNDYISKPLRFENIHSVAGKWLASNDDENIESDQTTDADINLLDLSTVESLKSILGDAYPDIVKEFFATTTKALNSIFEDKENISTEILIKQVHTFKGSSANIGACQLSFTFRQLEQNLKQNPDFELDEPIQNTIKLLEQCKLAFEEVL